MPLRPTEMRFVDDQSMVCPHCSRPRRVTDESCPHCSARAVLESLSRDTANFHISSLLLLTTLIAVCLALTRVSLALGIPAFLIVGLATLRTGLLVRHRKRHRYPVFTKDLLRLFGWSITGILLAFVAFGGALMVGGFFLAMLANTFLPRSETTAVIVFVLLIIGGEVGAIVMVGRRRESRPLLLIGTASAAVGGLIVLTAALGMRPDFASLTMLSFFAALGLSAVAIACGNGGVARAKSFIVGCSAGMCMLAVADLLLLSPWRNDEIGVAFGVSAALLLWPTLLSIMVLEKLWSWDDAFPKVAARTHPMIHAQRSRTPRAIRIEDDAGIKFADEIRNHNGATTNDDVSVITDGRVTSQ